MHGDQGDAALRRLVLEAGFAAVNHGLRGEMRAILAALPDWLDDPELLAGSQAILLFGLGDRAGALRQFDGMDPSVCAPMRQWLRDAAPRAQRRAGEEGSDDD